MSEELRKVLDNPALSAEQRERALQHIGESSAEPLEDEISADARAVVKALGARGLFAISAEQLEKFSMALRITGRRYEALREEWADFHLPSDELLRSLHLAAPETDIHWAWLKHWRDKLALSKKRIVRVYALRTIKMLAAYDKVPADVQAAASDFLTQYSQIEAGQPIPEIPLPDAKEWSKMPDDKLYQRMEYARERMSHA